MNTAVRLFRFRAASFSVVMLLSLLIYGCVPSEGWGRGKSVYYWRTVLKLSDAERSFLKDNDIATVYLHLFDVRDVDGELMPSSTLLFRDSIPSGIRVVPVVFIEPSALSGTASIDSLAARVVKRVDEILVSNGYGTPNELQIDFDWTHSNRDRYFEILESARQIMHSRDGRLSTTVRLHQLTDKLPPVDYGVLMMYNVGNITDIKEKNSILARNTIQPYMRALSRYELPLVTALPLYSWNIVFSGGDFKAIAHSVNPKDTTMFLPGDSGLYRCLKYAPLAMAGSHDGSGGRLYPGDILRHEFVSPDVLVGVLDDVRRANSLAAGSVILYHLDEKSLKQYDPEFLQTLLDGGCCH